MIKKEVKKIRKYKDTKIEIQHLWNVKINNISKSFRKYLNTTSGKHEINEVRKSTILSTANVLRMVLIRRLFGK